MFRNFVNVKDSIVSRNFFKDLEKPILASEVYSQYELEYLYDNVRPSEWVGRENHVYLHYTNWGEFCSWLAVLNMKPLLSGRQKLVFLIGDELAQYPIDFKVRFGIDYSRYPVEPLHIREINKLIWHTQLSSHNGGDFFNEIFDGHPNLLVESSLMFTDIEKYVEDFRKVLVAAENVQQMKKMLKTMDPGVLQEVYCLKNRTGKDFLVAHYLSNDNCRTGYDPSARIVPAIFFQPHFLNLDYHLRVGESGEAVLLCDEIDAARETSVFKDFKYVKTFTPLRRFTTSHGGAVRFMKNHVEEQVKTNWIETGEGTPIVSNVISERVLNRSYLRNSEDRLYKDAVVVRFEDGKLNPTATFTRLAAFLDLPYTESMTYCSLYGKRNPKEFSTNVVGFDTASVYKTYDDYVNDSERKYLEFFLRDAYAFYGYDFHYYDGSPVDLDRVKKWVSGFDTLNSYMRETYYLHFSVIVNDALSNVKNIEVNSDVVEQKIQELLDDFMRRTDELRIQNAEILLRGLHFVNKRGQPLEFTPMLEPDPDLLEQPLYH